MSGDNSCFTRPKEAQVYCDWSDPKFRQRCWAYSLIATLSVIGLWGPIFGISFDTYFDSVIRSIVLVPCFLVTMAAHEMLHAVFALWVSRAEKVWFQGWHRGALVVRSSGLVTRSHYVAELLAPFVIISIVIPALVAVCAPEFGWLATALSVANAFASSVDFAAAGATLTRSPKGSLVDGDGDELYFVAK